MLCLGVEALTAFQVSRADLPARANTVLLATETLEFSSSHGFGGDRLRSHPLLRACTQDCRSHLRNEPPRRWCELSPLLLGRVSLTLLDLVFSLFFFSLPSRSSFERWALFRTIPFAFCAHLYGLLFDHQESDEMGRCTFWVGTVSERGRIGEDDIRCVIYLETKNRYLKHSMEIVFVIAFP